MHNRKLDKLNGPRPAQNPVRYWVDIFAVSQHQHWKCPQTKGTYCQACEEAHSDMPDWEKMQTVNENESESFGFRRVIEHTSETLVVMDPWDQPRPPTRIWCLFEIFETHRAKHKVRVLLNAKQAHDMQLNLFANFAAITSTIQKINVEYANAFDAKDLKNIFAAIEESDGKKEGLNRIVQSEMLRWLAGRGAEFLDKTDPEVTTSTTRTTTTITTTWKERWDDLKNDGYHERYGCCANCGLSVGMWLQSYPRFFEIFGFVSWGFLVLLTLLLTAGMWVGASSDSTLKIIEYSILGTMIALVLQAIVLLVCIWIARDMQLKMTFSKRISTMESWLEYGFGFFFGWSWLPGVLLCLSTNIFGQHRAALYYLLALFPFALLMYTIMFASALVIIRADLTFAVGKLFLELYCSTGNLDDLNRAIEALKNSHQNFVGSHSRWSADPCVYYVAPWLIYALLIRHHCDPTQEDDYMEANKIRSEVVSARKRHGRASRCFFWCCNVSGRGNFSAKAVSIVIREVARRTGYDGRGFFWPLQYYEKNRVAGYDSVPIHAAWLQLEAHCYLSFAKTFDIYNENPLEKAAVLFQEAATVGLACREGKFWYHETNMERKDCDGNYIAGTSPFAPLCHLAGIKEEQLTQREETRGGGIGMGINPPGMMSIRAPLLEAQGQEKNMLERNWKHEQRFDKAKKCCTWPLTFLTCYLLFVSLFFNLLCGIPGYRVALGNNGPHRNGTDALTKLCLGSWAWGLDPA